MSARTTIPFLTFALSIIGTDAAPYNLEKRKGGGGGGGHGGGGGSRGGGRAGGGGGSGGFETWKVIVIVISILITVLFLLWFLPRYVLPRFGWWQRRLASRKLEACEAQRELDIAFAKEEGQRRKENMGGSAGGASI